jgi:hypothetical protein
VNVGTGEFKAVTAEVGILRAELGELREAVEAVRYNPTYVEMCMAMARGQGIEEGQAMVREAGIGWQLARLWPGGRARERQIKRQGGHARKCPLCGVTPRCLPRNADGSLSRSRTTDAQKAAAGVMTAAQLAEHTALRRGAVTGKLPRPFERGPLAEDPWAARAACPILAATP